MSTEINFTQNSNHGSVNGNVIFGNQTNISEKPLFSEINLDAYDDKEYISPNFTGQLVLKMNASVHNMLVITGFYGFDKATFIKHLAFQIIEDLKSKGQHLIAKECLTTSDHYGITTAIRESEENCVFILNNLKPKDVNHNLDELSKVATKHRKKVLVLVSSDLPSEYWRISNSDYWYTIQTEGLYHKGVHLVPNIYKKTSLLKYVLNHIDQRNLTTYKEKLREVLNKAINVEIYTLEQLDIFLDIFKKDPVNQEKKIWEIIRKTKKKDKLIGQWFETLPEEKKLIVIGMTLLEGMYGDQFFVIMDKLIADTWKPYVQSLHALDFYDLSTLLHFFHFTTGDHPVLQSKFPGQRLLTLNINWDSYQRRIQATLPILVELVIHSVENVYSDWELYGDKNKCRRIREVISEVLSDIGRLSGKAVERPLLSLAAHDNIEIQIVAAKALAKWRAPLETETKEQALRREKKLFGLLSQWLTNTRFSDLIEMFRKGISNENTNSSSTYIRSTIALTLAYAASYDSPNHLIKEVSDLLKNLARDRHPLVIRRLERAIQIILRNHPKQIGQQLFDLGNQPDAILNSKINISYYINAVAYGMVYAHNDFPEQVENVLTKWFEFCNNDSSKKRDETQFTYRDKILSVFIITIGSINYDKAVNYKLEKVIRILEVLRKEEHHERLRELLLNVIILLNEKHYKAIQPLSSRVIPNMKPEERRRIVLNFKNRYLQQRKKLTGGDHEVTIGKFKIESWIDLDKKPKTDVEELIEKWLDSSNDNIFNIAVQAYMEFIKILAHEEQLIQELQEKEQEKLEEESIIAKPKLRFEDRIKSSIMNNIFIKNRIAKTAIALAKEDENMGKLEMKLLAQQLKSIKKEKAASALNSFYVKYLT